jgi:ABC-type enterochelin transport system substrate-binding protein
MMRNMLVQAVTAHYAKKIAYLLSTTWWYCTTSELVKRR